MRKEKKLLRVGGIAGSGKTTMVSMNKSELGFKRGKYVAIAFSGQAAKRLRSVGFDACTAHSFMFIQCRDKMVRDGKVVLSNGIPKYENVWKLIEEIPEWVEIILIDEGSQFPESFLNHLIKINHRNIPIIMIGDPIQLPPVMGRECFSVDMLDYFLDEPVRQDNMSDIYKLSMDLRLGRTIDIDAYNYNFIRNGRSGSVAFILNEATEKKLFRKHGVFIRQSDMVLTGTNKQRNIISNAIRKYIFKTDSQLPQAGERMVCRKNNMFTVIDGMPLTNGTVGICMDTVGKEDVNYAKQLYYMNFQPFDSPNDFLDNANCDLGFLTQPFGPDKIVDKFNRGLKFEFAHAISVYSSQGNEYPTVTYYDHYLRSTEMNMRVRYTAVTRAKRELFFIL